MTTKEIRNELKNYSDFFGCTLISLSDISSAKTDDDFRQIIDRHESFLEDQLADALSHLNDLRQRCDL